MLPLKPQLPSKMSDLVPKTDLDYDGLVVLRLQGWGCGQDKVTDSKSESVHATRANHFANGKSEKP